MRLLQLNATANWGSTGKIAEGIGLAAMRRGWESYIAYGRYMNPSESQLIRVGSKLDVYAHYARARFLDGEGLGSALPTRRLINRIKEIKPDIIHLHNIHDHWLNYPILFDYLASVDTPVVWTFHDCWAFTGGCSHFENADCSGWKDSMCALNCPLSHAKAAMQFQRRKNLFTRLGKRLNIVCVSNWLADYVRESFLGDCGISISVINNGIDLKNFNLKPHEKENWKFILGVSNVWPPSKGLEDFMQLRKLIAPNIKMVLVGLSQNQIKSLPEGIIGLNRTSSIEQLADLYQQASVFVNPTHNDSFPTVNLEALACGTPVVTYRTGGSPEAVDASTGIVVDKGDVNGLAKAIGTILDNPEVFSPEACRQRAVECFDKDVQFDKYIDLYDNILNNQ